MLTYIGRRRIDFASSSTLSVTCVLTMPFKPPHGRPSCVAYTHAPHATCLVIIIVCLMQCMTLDRV